MAIINIQDLDLRSVCSKDVTALKVTAALKFPDGTTQITAAGSSQWVASVNDIYNANSGKVAIGMTGAKSKVDIYGGAGTGLNLSAGQLSIQSSDVGSLLASLVIRKNDSTPLWEVGNLSSAVQKFFIQDNVANAARVVIDIFGNIGIGLTNPAYQLQLSTDSAAKPTTNTWTIVSDARLKTVQREFVAGMKVIRRLRPVVYRYNGKGGFIDDGEHVNILAQDILDFAPELVGISKGNLNDTATDIFTYQGHNLQWMVVNALKELDARVTKLEVV